MTVLRSIGKSAAACLATAASVLAVGATSAQAANYPPTGAGTVTMSSTVVVDGGLLTESGGGFMAGETVSVDLHTATIHLATVQAGQDGQASASETIPADTPTGVHMVTMTGQSSGVVDSAQITVTAAGGSALGADNSGSSGSASGLPKTGANDLVPLMAIGGGGVLAGLLVLTLTRRARRKTS